jgi:hypothetical protein
MLLRYPCPPERDFLSLATDVSSDHCYPKASEPFYAKLIFALSFRSVRSAVKHIDVDRLKLIVSYRGEELSRGRASKILGSMFTSAYPRHVTTCHQAAVITAQ